MIYPKDIQKGDCIGVTATSDGIAEEADIRRLGSAIDHFDKLGYPVILTDNVTKSHKGRSSDGPTRAKELAQLLEAPQVGMIFAASGGDYLMEMLSHLDLTKIKEYPKWLQGFSDNTGLLYTITTHCDIATLYGNNFSAFGMEHWHSSLYDNLKLLEGVPLTQNSFDFFQNGYYPRITGLEDFLPEKEVHWKNLYPAGADTDKELTFQGRALGGTLDVFLNLIGTRFDKTKEFIQRYHEDKILWFLESYDLNSEALARGLWQLREAGWFEHAAGIIFGRPVFYEAHYDISYEEAVLSILGGMNLPIILDADIGHKPPQFTMINGAIACVRSFGGKGSITFERR